MNSIRNYDLSFWNPINRPGLLKSIIGSRVIGVQRVFKSNKWFKRNLEHYEETELIDKGDSAIRLIFENNLIIDFSVFSPRTCELKRVFDSSKFCAVMSNSYQSKVAIGVSDNPIIIEVAEYPNHWVNDVIGKRVLKSMVIRETNAFYGKLKSPSRIAEYCGIKLYLDGNNEINLQREYNENSCLAVLKNKELEDHNHSLSTPTEDTQVDLNLKTIQYSDKEIKHILFPIDYSSYSADALLILKIKQKLRHTEINRIVEQLDFLRLTLEKENVCVIDLAFAINKKNEIKLLEPFDIHPHTLNENLIFINSIISVLTD